MLALLGKHYKTWKKCKRNGFSTHLDFIYICSYTIEQTLFLRNVTFDLPHMEYEGSIGLVTRKNIFFITDFHVLGLFMTKKHDLNDKFFSVYHASLLVPVTQNLGHAYSLSLKS
jgi:hypothetical protein